LQTDAEEEARAFTQRRQGAKRYPIFAFFLCDFAPLREPIATLSRR
jgi:hypothetical protein